MTRKVFYSFHYQPDNWRVSQVRNIGAIEDNPAAKDNDWETITKGGDAKIKEWIDAQMKGRSCVVLLIGANTANRKWINYEIERAWSEKKGLVGIHIHKLKDVQGSTTTKGTNPLSSVTVTKSDGATIKLSDVFETHDPVGADSKAVYDSISKNLETWIDNAIKIRNRN